MYHFGTRDGSKHFEGGVLFKNDSIGEYKFSPTAKYGYLMGLDGMRAFAVMLVIMAHTGLTHVLPGGFGVTVFFFISGFLITRLLVAEIEKKGSIHLGNFYIRPDIYIHINI